MPLVTSAAHITMPKEELQQFLDNLAAIEKLCKDYPDLAEQMHYITMRFAVNTDEHEENAVICSNCGGIYCLVAKDKDGYHAYCRSCEHREPIEPSQEVKVFLDKQEAEDGRMNEEIYKVFRKYPIGRE